MILLCPFMKTARMLYISLPMLLMVKSLVFYFPSVTSCTDNLFYVVFGYFTVCYPRKPCLFFLPFYDPSFTVIEQIYIKIVKQNFVLVFYLCANLFFFPKGTVFFCNRRCTALFITNNVIPMILHTYLQNSLCHIQPVCGNDDRQPGKFLFDFCCKPYKGLAFTILF